MVVSYVRPHLFVFYEYSFGTDIPTRRDYLLWSAALAETETFAWGFKEDHATLRYQNWLGKFQRDIEKLSADAPEEEVRITCKSSIVPHSRATTTVSEWMKEANERRDARHGTRRYADLGSIAMLLLEHSVPAGYGGLFREAPESRFPSDRSSVWYMHIGGPDALQVYFDDKVQFPQLQTPAEWHAEASCLSVPVI